MIAVGLGYGVALCGFMGALIAVTLWIDPRIWQDDLPAAVKERIAPAPPESRRGRMIAGIVMLTGLVAIFGHLAWGLTPDLVAIYGGFALG